jgi:hypothetical protein
MSMAMGSSSTGCAKRALAIGALVLSCTSVLVTPSLAHADESAAETYFQEGLSAMKRGDYPAACEAFAESNRQDPSPGTQINLAVCFEKQKKWVSAWTWYRSAVGLAQQRGQKERETIADDAAKRLKPMLHYVVVSIKEPLTDLVVKRDGTDVAIALAGREVPLPVDPGEHVIDVSARGKMPYSRRFTVADNNQTDRVEIPKLENAPVDDKSAAGPGAGTTYQPPVIINSNDGSTQRTVGLVVGAAGLLSGLAGIGVFILAKNEESDRDKFRALLPDTPPSQQESVNTSINSHNRAAENNQLLAISLGAGAVVLVTVGAILYFTAPKGTPSKALAGWGSGRRFSPMVGPSYGGLGFTTAF